MESKQKPIVSYYAGNDPTKYMTTENSWTERLTEINIITTKNITDEFTDFVVKNKDKIFLHIIINGMGGSVLEPNIPSVKNMFVKVTDLIKRGFPQKQILIVVNPILNNDNGIKSLKLLLKAFTEFKMLRLRFIRFNLLGYKNVNDFKKKSKDGENEHIIKMSKSSYKEKYVVANQNITKRDSTRRIMQYLNKTESFWREYNDLLRHYESIISIDKGEEPLIGVRELMALGFNNSWRNEDGTMDKIIFYEKNSRFKPVVNLLNPGGKNNVRCPNRCLLCPFRY